MTSLAWPSHDDLVQAYRAAAKVAAQLHLALGQHRGFAGRALGTGLGSSIEYEDHRPFTPGDDPRYLDWAAFARSGQMISKVYREEVAPEVDVVIDISRSMFLGASKRQRSLELAYFTTIAAYEMQAAVVIHTVAGPRVRRHRLETFLAHHWLEEPSDDDTRVDLRRVAWRPQSMRVLVSDLLFPGAPHLLLRPVALRAGRASVFVPYTHKEIAPTFEGTCRLVDCETGASLVQHIDDRTLERFYEAYMRHFSLWRETCRKASVSFARIAAEPPLSTALEEEALPAHMVLPWT